MAKQITHEEYVARVEVAQASWEVITAYLGMNKKITFCEKETGVQWTAFAKTPFQGVSAPKPGSKRALVQEPVEADAYVSKSEAEAYYAESEDRVIDEPVTIVNVKLNDDGNLPSAKEMFQNMLNDKWAGDVQFTGSDIPENHKNKVALLHVPTGTKYRTTMNAALIKLPKNVVAA